jgi:fatty aldehyde-generating acyl-ACP reductase
MPASTRVFIPGAAKRISHPGNTKILWILLLSSSTQSIPDSKRDVSRKYLILGKILTNHKQFFPSTFFLPIYISEINGIISHSSGKEVNGWLIAFPYTPRRMLELSERTVYRKIIEAGRFAEKLGANILDLGAFTSAVGDADV